MKPDYISGNVYHFGTIDRGDYTEQGTVISLAIEEFGDRINTNYWDKRVIEYEDE